MSDGRRRVGSHVSIEIDKEALMNVLGYKSDEPDGGPVFCEIRRGIIVNFIDKYMKPLMETEVVKRMVSEVKQVSLDNVKKQIEDIVKQEFGKVVIYTKEGWSGKWSLSPDAQTTLRTQIQNEIKDITANYISEQASDETVKAMVERKVGSYSDWFARQGRQKIIADIDALIVERFVAAQQAASAAATVGVLSTTRLPASPDIDPSTVISKLGTVPPDELRRMAICIEAELNKRG